MMKLRLNSEQESVYFRDLKDGQIAVILPTNGCSGYAGVLVQKQGDDRVIKLGKPHNDSWSNLTSNNLLCRVLVAGDVITIE